METIAPHSCGGRCARVSYARPPPLRMRLPFYAVSIALGLLACAPRSQHSAADSPSSTMSASAGAWRPLFDGRSLAGWRGFRTTDPPTGWSAQDGLLVRTGAGGDLMTAEQFGDFELELEWRVGDGGNSGIIYRISGEGQNTYESGLEMQILDDAKHRDGQNALTSAGSLYGLFAAPRGIVKPAGEWNAARVVARGTATARILSPRRAPSSRSTRRLAAS